MTPMESSPPRTEGLPWSGSIPGLKDSRGFVPSQDRMTTLAGVIPFEDGMTALETFYPRTEGLSWSRSISGKNDSLESFLPSTEGLPGSRSFPGQNDSPRVVLTHGRMTPLQSFYPRTE